MEGLEEFLLQDEEQLHIFPDNLFPFVLGDMDYNLEERYWWEVEFPKVCGFESGTPVAEKKDHLVFQQERFVEEKQELQRAAQMQSEEDEDEDEDDTTTSDNQNKSGEGNSKNLQSERDRRRRLNQQLFTLRSLVPNITKMDKRSVLADALSYLQSLLEEIEKYSSSTSEPFASIAPEDDHASAAAKLTAPPPYERCAAHPAITEMNAQMLQDGTFVLEIGCNKAIGSVSQVLRLIEMLGLEITCSSVNDLTHDTMITTAFLHIKKKSLVTPEKLLNLLELKARQLGLHLPSDAA